MNQHHFEPQSHRVGCIYCKGTFDLFSTTWCDHVGVPHASKVCPHCRHCLCDHPMYRYADLWQEAPPVFQRHGFRKVFLFYI